MKVDLFDYELPPDRIADRPIEPRDAARLLVVGAGLEDRTIRDLPRLLAPGDLLLFNDTRVIPARLFGRRGEAKIEILLHQRLGDALWRAFARPAKRLKPGDAVRFAEDFSARVEEKGEAGEVTLRFVPGGADLMAALAQHGSTPLPPYIKRAADSRDRTDYQTLFAARDGAVAAPTAGLHMTERLLGELGARGIAWTTLTLHVGAGTFLPVKVEDTQDHRMHAEYGELSAEAADRINRTRAAGGRIVSVGTTCLRLVESAAAEDGSVRPFCGETRLFITPGYRFKIVRRLLTNFHLPRSTLFMLVASFAGLERMKRAYAHAIGTGYRFYSYGDATLLSPEEA
jgi:S-adenosylmethionine:tRNA ribosyltransferase-isomerase